MPVALQVVLPDPVQVALQVAPVEGRGHSYCSWLRSQMLWAVVSEVVRCPSIDRTCLEEMVSVVPTTTAKTSVTAQMAGPSRVTIVCPTACEGNAGDAAGGCATRARGGATLRHGFPTPLGSRGYKVL